jgi:hypothetical protein
MRNSTFENLKRFALGYGVRNTFMPVVVVSGFDYVGDVPYRFFSDYIFNFAVDFFQFVLKFESEMIVIDLDNLDIDRILLNKIHQFLNILTQFFFQFFNSRVIFNAQFKVNIDLTYILFGVIDNFTHIDFIIGNKDDIVVIIEKCGFIECDIQNFPFIVPYFDIIIDIEGLGKTDDKTTDNFADIFLGNDGYGSCHDTQCGEQAFEILSPKSENHGDDTKKDHNKIKIVDTYDDVVRKLIRDIFPESVYHYQDGCKNIEESQQKQELHDRMEKVVPVSQKGFINFELFSQIKQYHQKAES